ncbi:ComF family protein [Streptomyces canus]|uniref:ComF family protein n=1 Tax=Streptomyces canus TaxID=58343 RepID=UPI00386A27CD
MARDEGVSGAEVSARSGDVPGAELLGESGEVLGAGVSARGGDVSGAEALGRGGEVPGTEALVRGRDSSGVQALGRCGDVSGAEALGRAREDVPGTEVLAGGAVPGGEASRGGGLQAGAFVGGRWRGDGPGVPVLLVPVPSARRAVRARGHDPARRIALAAAGELRRAGMPARVVAVLRQRRRVADQSGLNSRQRLDNLAGALTVVPGGGRLLAEGLVVLVDDLMTTGASLTEAARAVREARVRENIGNRGEQMRAGHRDQRQQGAGGRRGCRPRETGARQGHRQAGTAGQRVQGGTDEWHGQRRQDVSGRRGGRGVAGCDGGGTGFVYTAATRESMGERLVTVTEEDTDRERCSVTAAGVGGVRDVICAAVVAAPPDSFEINRN